MYQRVMRLRTENIKIPNDEASRVEEARASGAENSFVHKLERLSWSEFCEIHVSQEHPLTFVEGSRVRRSIISKATRTERRFPSIPRESREILNFTHEKSRRLIGSILNRLIFN